MSAPKTQPTKITPKAFLAIVEPKEKRADSLALLKMFEDATGEKGIMWGSSIVGFGQYHYKSQRSAQEGDWMIVGFSPRKQNLTLYILHGNQGSKLLEKLGKHKTSDSGMGGCLYIKKLSDIDTKILAQLIKKSFHSKRIYS